MRAPFATALSMRLFRLWDCRLVGSLARRRPGSRFVLASARVVEEERERWEETRTYCCTALLPCSCLACSGPPLGSRGIHDGALVRCGRCLAVVQV